MSREMNKQTLTVITMLLLAVLGLSIGTFIMMLIFYSRYKITYMLVVSIVAASIFVIALCLMAILLYLNRNIIFERKKIDEDQ